MGTYNKIITPFFGTPFVVDKTKMFSDSLSWHARLDVQTSDDRDFLVMQALTRARNWTRGNKTIVNDRIRDLRKCFGSDPRTRSF
jgi:hypothetical protein